MAIITADTVPSIRAGGSHFPGHRSAFFLKSWNTCYTRYTKITCDLACKELWGNISCRRWTTPKHVSRGWISQQFAYGYSVFRHVQWSERQPFQHSSEYVTSFCSWLVFWCQCLSLSLSLSLSRCSRKSALFCTGFGVYRKRERMCRKRRRLTKPFLNFV